VTTGRNTTTYDITVQVTYTSTFSETPLAITEIAPTYNYSFASKALSLYVKIDRLILSLKNHTLPRVARKPVLNQELSAHVRGTSWNLGTVFSIPYMIGIQQPTRHHLSTSGSMERCASRITHSATVKLTTPANRLVSL